MRGRSRRKRIRSASSGWIFSSLIFPNSPSCILNIRARVFYLKKEKNRGPTDSNRSVPSPYSGPTASVPVSASRLCNMCWPRLHFSRPQGNEQKRGRPENYSSGGWVRKNNNNNNNNGRATQQQQRQYLRYISYLGAGFLVHCNRDIHSWMPAKKNGWTTEKRENLCPFLFPFSHSFALAVRSFGRSLHQDRSERVLQKDTGKRRREENKKRVGRGGEEGSLLVIRIPKRQLSISWTAGSFFFFFSFFWWGVGSREWGQEKCLRSSVPLNLVV